MQRNLKFKFARITSGLTQFELAVRSEVPLSRIQRIESGYVEAYVDEVERISTALNVDARKIFDLPKNWKVKVGATTRQNS